MNSGFWILCGSVSLCLCGAVKCGETGGGAVRNAPWTWALPGERYKQLGVFERAQYDKAAAFFKNNDYRAAGSEFEKFKVQFQDSALNSTLAYVNFMCGYCLYLTKERHAAIKVFTEVLDYFKNETEDAAAALFFKGLAQLDNGDTRPGLQCMQQMAEDKKFRHHPLAAGALRRLAESFWKQKQTETALKYWKQVCADFAKANPEEAKEARNSVASVYLRNGDYAGYENWLVGEADRENVPHRRWVALVAGDAALEVFDQNNFPPPPTPSRGGEGAGGGPTAKEAQQQGAHAYFTWFKTQKPWFEKSKDLWSYYDRCINFLVQRLNDKKDRDETVNEVSAFLKAAREGAKDEPARQGVHHKLSWLVDRLCEMGDWTQAQLCAGSITDAPYSAYKNYEILGRRQKWKEGVALLEEIEKSANQQWVERAKEERARVYREFTGEYELAIKLYREIDKPPGTLWNIQDAYKRWGKLKEALTTLTEIENSFPDQAAASAWRKAQYLEEAGDKNAVVAQCRRFLKLYKAAPEAGAVQQLLKKYILQTGGGVFDKGE